MDENEQNSNTQQTHNKITTREGRLRWIQSLVHSCQCRDANCRLPSCQKMKRVVAHTKNCKRKTHGRCQICRQLVALCCYHAKHCHETKCLVLLCSRIKLMLKRRRENMANTRMAQSNMEQQQNPLRESLQQLMQALHNPVWPDQQQQILEILRNNPLLMAAFIRQRQAQNGMIGVQIPPQLQVTPQTIITGSRKTSTNVLNQILDRALKLKTNILTPPIL